MRDFLTQNYMMLKAFHIISIIAWMAGLFYLPRLFYYHATKINNPEISDLFSLMERRLLTIIMNPAQIATYFFGVLLAFIPGILSSPNGWFHVKIFLVLMMSAFHGFCIKWSRSLAQGLTPFAPNTFRFLNEIPTLLLLGIVFLVVLKPF